MYVYIYYIHKYMCVGVYACVYICISCRCMTKVCRLH